MTFNINYFLGGTTLHTGLGFKFGSRQYLPLRDAKLEHFRTTFEELEFIIMDEFSMISSDRLYDVHRRMEEILISKDRFGGRSVMLVGDIMQLPPVKGQPIYSPPFSKKNRSLFTSSESLWKNFKVATLSRNLRQGVSDWTECLNRIRIGEPTEEDLAFLESRRLKNFPDLDQKEACHVFYTNLEVDNHNSKMLNLIKSEIVNVQAEGFYPKGYRPTIVNGMIDNTPFMKKLSLKKGARVVLTFNVCLADSLVNGSLGTVEDFLFEGSKLKAIIIAFDNKDIGTIPIYRTNLEHSLKAMGGARGKTIQFPLRLAWACTCHRLQGTTIKKGSNLIIHGNKKTKMPKNMYYVMLSRCSSPHNVFLDEMVDFEHISCNQKALDEKNRLDEQSETIKVQNTQLDIFFVNIRSYSNHQEDLECDLFAKNSDCICLAETWIYPNQQLNHSFPNKVSYAASIGKGRGCGVIIPKESHLIDMICQESFQALSFVKKNFQVTIVYLSWKDINIASVTDLFRKLIVKSQSQLIIGDFNFDAGESNQLVQFFKECDLVQIVTEPTHMAGRTIDHVYVSAKEKELINVKTMFKYYSDHAALQIKLTD